MGGKTIVMWPPPALSVNGLFTETDGIMAWVLAGAESDGSHTPLRFWSSFGGNKKKKPPYCKKRRIYQAATCAVYMDRTSCWHRQVCKSNSWSSLHNFIVPALSFGYANFKSVCPVTAVKPLEAVKWLVKHCNDVYSYWLYSNTSQRQVLRVCSAVGLSPGTNLRLFVEKFYCVQETVW